MWVCNETAVWELATDKEGKGYLGRGSFGMDKLLDNVREVMNEIHAVMPESFGKGKKGQKGKVAKGTKYYLKAHLSATQGGGVSWSIYVRLIPRVHSS